MRVLTIGTFAVPHLGHAAFLARSAMLGELVVGVNSDAFVQRYKGSRPPYDQAERMDLISSLGYRVRLNDGPGRELVRAMRPDILTVGTDWARRDYLAQIDVTQDELDEWGVGVLYLPMRPVGISSTGLMERLAG